MRIGRGRAVLGALCAVAAVVAGVATASPRAARTVAHTPLIVGLQDDRMADPVTDPGPRMALVAGVRARLVRVDLRWDLVARSRPQTPTDPGDPAYDWSHYDAVVAAARARGIQVLFAVWGTPAWAGDDTTPDGRFPSFGRAPRDPADAGAFATAAAARYTPQGVTRWEMWNEPNIPLFLRPQYRRVGTRWEAASPAVYAAIASAMYAGIKSVDPAARVAGGVTAPVGDPDPQNCANQPECRVRPQDFLRALDAPGLRPPMDAWAHHPYPLRKPSTVTPPGISYVDLYNLTVLTRALDRSYLAGTPVWLTEFGFATRRTAEYPFHVNRAQQALFMADAFRRVRANPRVRVFVWYLLQDHPDWASGLYTMAGRAKPAAALFRSQAPRGRG
ncbi:MAG: hypothetical protein U0Y82_12895 [Thermoleophilia bacterium]